jgi:hypothetical protein
LHALSFELEVANVAVPLAFVEVLGLSLPDPAERARVLREAAVLLGDGAGR